ncbi:MAG: quinolinate synthase NadA [Planctomycetes bacterium]|nr:quinolinate synthase NadA [Planctomycetota bacterium]MBL7106263.1 quinolinate synthase NadA [Phycisphaerae bacterium]
MLSQSIIKKINELKKQKNAVILAHNYQSPEIQDIADFTGDSLGLSIQASKTDAELIVFCGVMFMAETAAILSPKKTVLIPEKNAGCPMADMITADQLRKLKAQHPDALVVCYVNSTAAVKAESDYCCTSSNAVSVVNSLPTDRQIIFVPDVHLARYTAETTNRDLILWPGYCPTHVMITEDDIKNAKAEHPDALVLAHPECSEPVKKLADHLLSTGQMLDFAAESDTGKFIIATETGIIHSLKKKNPDTDFIPATERAICPNMKKINLEKVLWSLEDMQYIVSVDKEIGQKAKKALDRMVSILPQNIGAKN